MPICPECGAGQGDSSCEERFHQILIMESYSEKLYAEHFKTVACYNIQHPAKFQDDAIEGLVKSLYANLYEGVTVEAIRKQNQRVYNGSKTVLKKEKDVMITQKHWRVTIEKVYVTDQPNQTAENVVKWAKSIIDDIEII